MTYSNELLTAFTKQIFTDQQEKNHVHYQIGRRYVRVLINNEVRYFVDTGDGSIYGKKSAQAPNLKWYFGNIENHAKWDWSDKFGRPVTDDSVRAVGHYGPFTHYMRV
jgi:hypothetical protein